MIKVAAPNMACKVIDWAIQAFGGAGVTNDFGLAAAVRDGTCCCGLPTVPTRCIATRSARLELRLHAEGPARSAQRVRPDVAVATNTFEAVLWDLGGVILSGPFDAFAGYEPDARAAVGFPPLGQRPRADPTRGPGWSATS